MFTAAFTEIAMRFACLLAVTLMTFVVGCSSQRGLSQVQVDAKLASAGFVERSFPDMHPEFP